jgi:hypothetical protein
LPAHRLADAAYASAEGGGTVVVIPAVATRPGSDSDSVPARREAGA